jgi:hypothetical protein
LATPMLGEAEFEHALAKLGVAAVFSEADVHETYLEIAGVYGAWLAEEESKEVSSVATALRRTGKNLIEASILKHRPGEYELVRRILGHKSIQTTMNFYLSMETTQANEI